MPEENENDQDKGIEEEMMRMMQEEFGEEGDEPATAEGEGADTGTGLDADMLQALQGETEAGGDEEGGGAEGAIEAEMLRAMVAGTGASEEAAQDALQQATHAGGGSTSPIANALLDVKLSVAIELGSTWSPIETVLDWTEGSLIELSKVSGDAVDVLINGRMFARGEVVTVAENFGVRLTSILPTVGRQTQP